MNKKKIIILAILFVAVAGFALEPASAAAKTHKTDKLYFKQYEKNKFDVFVKKLNKANIIEGLYTHPKVTSQGEPNSVLVGFRESYPAKQYKITKIKIKFKKTVKGKTYYSTKTFNKNSVYYKPKNNYRPHYAIVYYKK
ncbi:MAG: hypothetical protein FWE58_00195 [Methanobrevibacter sp.]|nr:hypothetical protein [Methanobrevibacter sp.]